MFFRMFISTMVLLASFPASAQLTPVQSAGSAEINLLKNPGAENGVKSGYVASGLAVSSDMTLGPSAAFKINSSATAQTFASVEYLIPAAFEGRKCQVHIPRYKYASGSAGDYMLKVLNGEEVTLLSLPFEVTGSSATKPLFQTFDCPALNGGDDSDKLKLVIESTADAGDLIFDDLFLGQGRNQVSSSQNIFIGSAYFATTVNCVWSRNSATMGAFSTDVDCPAPTIIENPGPGVIQTTDADLPRFTFNGLTPGRYKVTMHGPNGAASNTAAVFAVSDGSITYPGTGHGFGTSTGQGGFSVVGWFTYTSTGNRTFELYAASSVGAVNIENDLGGAALSISVERYPLNSTDGTTYETTGTSWHGYHDSTCSWTRTNTTYGDMTADASCALIERSNVNFGSVTTSGSVLPAITFTPKESGKLDVCAFVKLGGNVVQTFAARLWDGANELAQGEMGQFSGGSVQTIPLCTQYNATGGTPTTLSVQTKSATGQQNIASATGGPAIEWKISSISQSLPMPVFDDFNKKTSAPIAGARQVFGVITASSCTFVANTSSGGVSISGTNTASTCTLTFSPAFTALPSCSYRPTQSNGCVSSGSGSPTTSTELVQQTACNTGSGISNGQISFHCIGY